MSYVPAYVFSFLHLTHKIKPRCVETPTHLGLYGPVSNNNNFNQIKTKHDADMGTCRHRGRVSPSSQGARFPR